MGVSGCGKSSLAAAVAAARGAPLIEADAHHSPANLDKMRQGIALTDADRAGWLDSLAQALLQARSQGVVMTCSALKRAYRDRLRAAAPGLRFAFLQISREEAGRRVASRAGHFFAGAGLVDNQFATLEPPVGEPGVLTLDAALPLDTLCQQVLAWLNAGDPA
ncbi:gluconokinase [Ideonella sp. TBM-1]|uniref:Gluconokinase n=2 Tax=Ideonella livida TaxID=2707176 RepID=A0A7C9PJ47_9BURK|nr:gluconokinase [Ideonella livida]